jgi:MSHA biogenesis protein MshN
LQRLNRHAEAADLFASALQSAPGNGVWWMGLGISLAAEGRTDTARDAFSRARASGSLSPELAQYVEQRLRQLL